MGSEKRSDRETALRGLANRGLPFWPHQVLHIQHRKPPDLGFSQAFTFRYAFGRTTPCYLFPWTFISFDEFPPLCLCVRGSKFTYIRGTRNRKDLFRYAATILSYLLFCFSGNSYNIKNLRQTEAKLTFVQIKGWRWSLTCVLICKEEFSLRKRHPNTGFVKPCL